MVAGAIALGAWAAPAAAHPLALAVDPPPGSDLPNPPARIAVTFSEAVDVARSSLAVRTARGGSVAASPPAHLANDPTSLSVTLNELPRGDLFVVWRVVGDDTHVVAGSTAFRVLGGPLASAAQRATAKPVGSPSGLAGLRSLLRALSYLALCVLVGGTALVAWLWRPVANSERVRRWLRGALVGTGIVTVLAALVQEADSRGSGIAGLVRPATVTGAFGSRFGHVALLTLVLLALAAVLMRDVLREPSIARSPGWWIPAGAVGVCLMRTPSLVDHGFAAGPVRAAVYLLHMSAVAVWVGGLLTAVVVLVPRPVPGLDAADVIRRFSPVAGGALAVVAMTGAALAAPLVEHWSRVASPYAHLLLLKLSVAAAIVLVAAANRRRARHSGGPVAARVRNRSLGAEAALMCVAVGVAALLSGHAPATQVLPSHRAGDAAVASAH